MLPPGSCMSAQPPGAALATSSAAARPPTARPRPALRRPNARKALKKIISSHPASALPRRYAARLLYHEAASTAGSGDAAAAAAAAAPAGSAATSLRRIQLLQEAYDHASVATALAPNSLSCAALRATLAINLLVEESALLTPASSSSSNPGGSSSGEPGGHAAAQQQQQLSALDSKCQQLRERFRDSITACRAALEHANPLLVEPVITMITSTHTTCDPCSLVSSRGGAWRNSRRPAGARDAAC